MVFELEVDFAERGFEGPLGELTGYHGPGSKKPISRIKAITHRNYAFLQASSPNHILKPILSYEASIYSMVKAQHPTVTKVASTPRSG